MWEARRNRWFRTILNFRSALPRQYIHQNLSLLLLTQWWWLENRIQVPVVLFDIQWGEFKFGKSVTGSEMTESIGILVIHPLSSSETSQSPTTQSSQHTIWATVYICTYLFGIIWTKCPDSSNRQLSNTCHGERWLLFFENSPSSWQQNARRSRGSCFGFYLAPTPESFPLISMKNESVEFCGFSTMVCSNFLMAREHSYLEERERRREREVWILPALSIAGALFLKL